MSSKKLICPKDISVDVWATFPDEAKKALLARDKTIANQAEQLATQCVKNAKLAYKRILEFYRERLIKLNMFVGR